MKDIPVPSKANEVSLLIGQDVPDALKPLEIHDGGDNEDDFSLQVCDTAKKNFSVDDHSKSVPNVTKAKILVSEVSKLLACGGFLTIRKF